MNGLRAFRVVDAAGDMCVVVGDDGDGVVVGPDSVVASKADDSAALLRFKRDMTM
jgi:hypothetical protein